MTLPTIVQDQADSLLLLSAERDLLPTFDVEAVGDQLRAAFPSECIRVHETAGKTRRWVKDGPTYAPGGGVIREGRTFRLEVGLGTVAVRAFDPARAERVQNPDLGAESMLRPDSLRATWEAFDREHDAPGNLRWIGDAADGYGRWLQEPETPNPGLLRRRRSRVSEWSARSRSRMLRAFAELDYRAVNVQPGIPAMVTLTYPGEWETVTPTFEASKRHVLLLLKRFAREYGYRPAGLWKMEFQRRGAPHYHLFMSVPVRASSPFCDLRGCDDMGYPSRLGYGPEHVCKCATFEEWLAWTWAEIVDHPDGAQWARHIRAGTNVSFGAASRCTDGRRLAVYFLKHGTKTKDGKEYQNRPPQAWDIQADPVTGEVLSDGGTGRFWGYWGMKRRIGSVDIPLSDWYRVRRVLRRWRKSQGQRVRGLGSGGGNSGGWALVNDGPVFAALLSRSLAAAG